LIEHSSISRPTKQETTRVPFIIPRAHMPTLGTGGDIFSLDNRRGGPYSEASDSNISSPTLTNRPDDIHLAPNFDIFDDLERRRPPSQNIILRPQMDNMLNTLNSLPRAVDDDPAGTYSEGLNDLDEVVFVTDMLEDMTKDDEVPDEFVEALNPNLAIPRSTGQPETKPSGWFSVC
jgi:hypothetical protein